MKSYTDIKQSKKLTEILPLESADYCWGIDVETLQYNNSPYPCAWKDYTCKKYYIPCWSLASLLEQLPDELCNDDGQSLYLKIYKEDGVYILEYTDPYWSFNNIKTDRFEHFIDACFELMLKLNELNLL